MRKTPFAGVRVGSMAQPDAACNAHAAVDEDDEVEEEGDDGGGDDDDVVGERGDCVRRASLAPDRRCTREEILCIVRQDRTRAVRGS